MGRGRRAVGGALLVAALAACGGQEFTYLSSDDGHMFGKIPADWEVERQGAITYTLLAEDLLPDGAPSGPPIVDGDSTVPWRAEFGASGLPADVPHGSFESQLIDARLRGALLSELIDNLLRSGTNDLERVRVQRGELEGYRVRWTIGDGDDYRRYDEVFLVDDRRAGLYVASVRCDDECHERFADEIDEILTTFMAEP